MRRFILSIYTIYTIYSNLRVSWVVWFHSLGTLNADYKKYTRKISSETNKTLHVLGAGTGTRSLSVSSIKLSLDSRSAAGMSQWAFGKWLTWHLNNHLVCLGAENVSFCFLECARHPAFPWDNKNAIPGFPKVALSFQVSSLPHCTTLFWLSHSNSQDHQQDCPAESTNVHHPQEIHRDSRLKWLNLGELSLKSLQI